MVLAVLYYCSNMRVKNVSWRGPVSTALNGMAYILSQRQRSKCGTHFSPSADTRTRCCLGGETPITGILDVWVFQELTTKLRKWGWTGYVYMRVGEARGSITKKQAHPWERWCTRTVLDHIPSLTATRGPPKGPPSAQS